jgi:hypothetical protein
MLCLLPGRCYSILPSSLAAFLLSAAAQNPAEKKKREKKNQADLILTASNSHSTKTKSEHDVGISPTGGRQL